MKHKYEETIRKLKENDKDLTTLDLKHQNLTSEESAELFRTLEVNTIVTKLQYLNNNSTGDAAMALSSMLQKNQTIEELELGSNGLNNEDVILIINGLKQNSSVVILDLNSNPFDAATPIADLLEHNNYIKEIELTNSNINDAGFSEIYEALQRNENSSLTNFSVYFPLISCMSDFENFCNANTIKLESSIRLF